MVVVVVVVVVVVEAGVLWERALLVQHHTVGREWVTVIMGKAVRRARHRVHLTRDQGTIRD